MWPTRCTQLSKESRKTKPQTLKEGRESRAPFNHSPDYATSDQLMLQLADMSHLAAYEMISYPALNLLALGVWRMIVVLHFKREELRYFATDAAEAHH